MSETKAIVNSEKTICDAVQNRVAQLAQAGRFDVPPNYSVANALQSAYLILQETLDTNKQPVLQSCTRESIANALFNMVVQGLNPSKKQCYFIPYGKALTCQRSYFGAIHQAKQANPNIEDIVGEVIYYGDEFEFTKKRGKTVVTKHVQKLENVEKSKIQAAYGTILYLDGTEESVIMTAVEVYQAWKQSRQNPFTDKGDLKETSVHGKFTADMMKRTVINKACKLIINSSDDSSIVIQHYKDADLAIEQAQAQEEISQKANTIVIDADGVVIEDTRPGTEEQAEQKDEQPKSPTARSNRPKPTAPKAEQEETDGDNAEQGETDEETPTF